MMSQKEKVLQLLSSRDKINVMPALQLTEGSSGLDLKSLLEGYLKLYHCFFNTSVLKILPNHITYIAQPNPRKRTKENQRMATQL